MNPGEQQIIDDCMQRILGEAQDSVQARRPYLSSFVLPSMLLESLLTETQQLRHVATAQRRKRNVLSTIVFSHSSNSITSSPMVKHNLSIATFDKIRKDGTIAAFYKASTQLMQKLFTSGIYPPTDKLSPVNVNFMNPDSRHCDRNGEEDELGDHFDGVDFVVVVLLQKSDRGGELRVCKQNIPENWTDEQRQTFAKEERDRSYPNSLQLNPPDGSLYILNGRCNLHAVLPPKGEKERISLVMSFYKTPNGSFEKHFGSFYGAQAR